ncbi:MULTISPECIES: hypothetical protein [unclassified Corynebacterium]|uniref:hypothetical protein n=1 Tax=unclassified Corynebacterium TaxID=2624378 RepID=UPI0029CA4F08|nr:MULTISPECIES: hypothetical protein [unclassified Corynebacterium]WPF65555.1 hypothetical protein OLX12_08210 [Corynebacterium sp. 22KM0430]WPF68050.1 hypothetical protein OLW90_08200 [Corynebacterium sp. 21KM1197]
MTALYDWLVQSLVASPLALQIAVVLGVALPACAVAALFLQRAVDLLSDVACRLVSRGGRTVQVDQPEEHSEKEPPRDA